MEEIDVDVEYLRSVVVQERTFRDTLEEYCNELAAAMAELEEQKSKGDDQNSEWKTRYEIQQELNEQFRKQNAGLQDKLATAAKMSQDFQRSARANAAPAAFGTATESTLAALEREKRALSAQLLNIELRVDQEAKAYHKANEERKAVQLDIGAVNAQLTALKMPPATAANEEDGSGQSGSRLAGKKLKSGGGGIGPKNIPPNQRVINPKLGPVKKTAAVKQLPPL